MMPVIIQIYRSYTIIQIIHIIIFTTTLIIHDYSICDAYNADSYMIEIDLIVLFHHVVSYIIVAFIATDSI